MIFIGARDIVTPWLTAPDAKTGTIYTAANRGLDAPKTTDLLSRGVFGPDGNAFIY